MYLRVFVVVVVVVRRVPVVGVHDAHGHRSGAVSTQADSRVQVGGAVVVKLRLHELHKRTQTHRSNGHLSM